MVEHRVEPPERWEVQGAVILIDPRRVGVTVPSFIRSEGPPQLGAGVEHDAGVLEAGDVELVGGQQAWAPIAPENLLTSSADVMVTVLGAGLRSWSGVIRSSRPPGRFTAVSIAPYAQAVLASLSMKPRLPKCTGGSRSTIGRGTWETGKSLQRSSTRSRIGSTGIIRTGCHTASYTDDRSGRRHRGAPDYAEVGAVRSALAAQCAHLKCRVT